MTPAPSLFISHRSPMFALEPGLLGANLRAIGESLGDVVAVLVVSPHWQTQGVRVGSSPMPETLHDFAGFPAPLYALQYPAPGAPKWAYEAAKLLAQAGFETALDERHGLDHGAWVPLRHLFPKADKPVFQVSLPHDVDAPAPGCTRGVLIVGSGSLTHNLYEFRQHVRDPEYAQEFADWVRDAGAARDFAALADYRRRAPHAARAHPSEEHYLPLLVAAGASDTQNATRLIEGGMTYAVLSMDALAVGLPGAESRARPQ